MSKTIPKQVLEEIRARCDIVELIGGHLPLIRTGSTFKALCPFHKEKTPSFHVNPQRQIFHCFGCGKGGDVFRFLMDYEGVDFMTAVNMLAERVGVTLEYEKDAPREKNDKKVLYKLHQDLALEYHKFLLESPEAEIAREYLKKRELDLDTIKKFTIGYAPNRYNTLQRWGAKRGYSMEQLEAAGLVAKSDPSLTYYDRFRDRLIIPIRDELGRVIAFTGRIIREGQQGGKYVNSPETVLFHKSKVLFALDLARRAIADEKRAVLCEGQIDAIRCHQAGFNTVIAAQGTALTDTHVHIIKRYADSIVLLLDADEAGQKAALRAMEICLAAGIVVSVAELPVGEDPDSLIRDHGPQALKDLLDKSCSALDFLVRVFGRKFDLSTEYGLVQVSRQILNLIQVAPSEIQKEFLLKQAVEHLQSFIGTDRVKALEDSLRLDLRKATSRAARAPIRNESSSPRPAPIVRPKEEVSLAELLISHRELVPLVKKYLSLEQITDVSCRLIVKSIINSDKSEGWDLMNDLNDCSEEAIRLAAQLMATEPRSFGQEYNAESAIKDLILVIRRRVFERERHQIRASLRTNSSIEAEQRSVELTHDINLLRQGWDAAVPILDLGG